MTTTPAISTPARRSLGERVQQLATSASRPDADRVLRIIGPVLLPTGAIVILLGWYGAASTTRVFLQIPYLISGGLLGLGLMFAGGFLYFTRWITDLLDESRRNADQARSDAERTAKALERIEGLPGGPPGGWHVDGSPSTGTGSGGDGHTGRDPEGLDGAPARVSARRGSAHPSRRIHRRAGPLSGVSSTDRVSSGDQSSSSPDQRPSSSVRPWSRPAL